MVPKWAALAAAIAAVMRRLGMSARACRLSPNSALDALGRRYLDGHIRRDEYEELRRDLAD